VSKVLKSDVVYTAKPISLYNYQAEVFEKFSGGKANKGDRVIPVVNFKKKTKNRIVYKKVTYTFLKLHIEELDREITIDIRSYLKNRYKGCDLSKKFLNKLELVIAKEISVAKISGKWEIVDYDTLFVK
jgi:hypothetical protein